MPWFLDSEYENLSGGSSYEGGFASVFKVRHRKLGYIRAIRILKEPVTGENDPKYLKFLNECRLLLRIGNGGHPNIVRISQPRIVSNHAIVEMEFVHGSDLLDYIATCKGYVPTEEVLRFVSDISSALAYCHVNIYHFCYDRHEDDIPDDPYDGAKVIISPSKEKELINKYKVIHNDIHSKNVMRKYDGNYILLDFGLSIQADEVVKTSKRAGGVAEYKAPEKWEDQAVITEQTDIYAFGILMFEMLTGRVPFPLKKLNSFAAEQEVYEKHLNQLPPEIEPLRRAAFERTNPGKVWQKDYPDWLEYVIRKCLEKKPENRYANGAELDEDINRFAYTAPPIPTLPPQAPRPQKPLPVTETGKAPVTNKIPDNYAPSKTGAFKGLRKAFLFTFLGVIGSAITFFIGYKILTSLPPTKIAENAPPFVSQTTPEQNASSAGTEIGVKKTEQQTGDRTASVSETQKGEPGKMSPKENREGLESAYTPVAEEAKGTNEGEEDYEKGMGLLAEKKFPNATTYLSRAKKSGYSGDYKTVAKQYYDQAAGIYNRTGADATVIKLLKFSIEIYPTGEAKKLLSKCNEEISKL
jgi:serine/threonine protein kinase